DGLQLVVGEAELANPAALQQPVHLGRGRRVGVDLRLDPEALGALFRLQDVADVIVRVVALVRPHDRNRVARLLPLGQRLRERTGHDPVADRVHVVGRDDGLENPLVGALVSPGGLDPHRARLDLHQSPSTARSGRTDAPWVISFCPSAGGAESRGDAWPPSSTFNGVISSSPPSTWGRFSRARASLRVMYGAPTLVESCTACSSNEPFSFSARLNST